MGGSVTLERYLRSLEVEARAAHPKGPVTVPERRPTITISRQAGAGSRAVAEAAVAILADHTHGSWTIVDRDLVARVLEDHHLPAELERSMPEDRVSEFTDTLDQLFGLRPSTWTLVRKTAETILRLAELGNVVVIGRGGNLVTKDLDRALHVRLVGSLPVRTRHVMDVRNLDRNAAEEYVRTEDQRRRRYVRRYYEADIDSPLLYHLVLNTDRFPPARAGELIADAVLRMVVEDAPAALAARASLAG
jgi:Cytidylate kinase-like family